MSELMEGISFALEDPLYFLLSLLFLYTLSVLQVRWVGECTLGEGKLSQCVEYQEQINVENSPDTYLPAY